MTLIEKRIALIGNSWYNQVGNEFDKPYFKKMSLWISNRRKSPFVIVYPEIKDTFKAFLYSSYEDTKVIVIAQDPYYNGVATGIAFGAITHYKDKNGLIAINDIPKSLINIWREMETDVEFGLYLDFDYSLKSHAKQGVLFLNRVLTVDSNKPDSHAFIGWEIFTDTVIKKLNNHTNKLVFMLWGNIAQKVKPIIDKRHLVLEAKHPASRVGGFLGCKHFSKCNEFLKSNNQQTIKW